MSIKLIRIQADQVIKFCITIIIFFLPLFFFPLSGSYLELNKMLLFDLLTLLAFLAWLLEAIFKKSIVMKLGLINTLVIIFGLVYLLASIFSVNRFLSFMGDNLSYASLINIFFFILFYFLLVNTVVSFKEGLRLLKLFMLSGFIVILYYLTQLIGLHILPFSFSQNNAFNLIANSINIFVIYLVVLFMISFGFVVKSTKPRERIWGEVLMLLVFGILFFLDLALGWILLTLGLFAWLIFLSMQSKKIELPWVIVPTILLVLSLIFLFLYTPALTLINPPTDIKLDSQTSFAIAKSSLANNFLVGKGPETFLYAFDAYRPMAFNNSALGQLNFDRSYSEIFQLITSTGIFPFLILLFIVIYYLFTIGKNAFFSPVIDEQWFFKVILFIAFFVIFISAFLQPFSAVTSFIFWFLLGLGGLLINNKEKRYNLQKSTGLNFVFSLLFAFLLIGAISFIYFGTRIWLSDYYLAKAQRIVNKTGDLNKSTAEIIQGTNLNPWLSTPHFVLANTLLLGGKVALTQNDSNTALDQFNQAKIAVENAISRELKNGYTFEQAVDIYQAIKYLGGDIDDNEVISYFTQAIKLDPNNAGLWYNFGKFYLTQAQNIQTTISQSKENEVGDLDKQLAAALNLTNEKLKKAAELKKNYWETELAQAQVLELQGNYDQALALVDNSLKNDSTNLILLEEKGKLLIAQNKLDNAKEIFQYILAFSPTHANAHFWLATIYEQQGNKDKAIKELEIVLKNNPDNQLVLQKLSELKK